MKEDTLKKCYKMLTEIDKKRAFIVFIFTNKFIIFPTYMFREYKNKEEKLNREIIEISSSLNRELQHNKLNFIEINTDKKFHAKSMEVNFNEEKLDQYTIKLVNDFLVEEKIKQI